MNRAYLSPRIFLYYIFQSNCKWLMRISGSEFGEFVRNLLAYKWAFRPVLFQFCFSSYKKISELWFTRVSLLSADSSAIWFLQSSRIWNLPAAMLWINRHIWSRELLTPACPLSYKWCFSFSWIFLIGVCCKQRPKFCRVSFTESTKTDTFYPVPPGLLEKSHINEGRGVWVFRYSLTDGSSHLTNCLMALRKCDPLLIVCIWMSKAVIYAVTTRLFLEGAGGNGGENLILISIAIAKLQIANWVSLPM